MEVLSILGQMINSVSLPWSLSDGLLGILIVGLMTYFLFKGKATPIVVFILLPVVIAFLGGYNLTEIHQFATAGVKKVSNNAVLFIFSVIFFGIISDTGLFDVIVEKLIGIAGHRVIAIALVTGVVAIIAHLDGATVTTVLVTVPAFLPLYRKLNIRPHLILLIIGAAMGVMNLVSWGGPVVRTSIVLETFGIAISPNELWITLIPIQILGIIVTLSIAAAAAYFEVKNHGAGIIQDHADLGIASENVTDAEKDRLRRTEGKQFWINLLIVVAVIFALMTSVFKQAYFTFMIGVVVALLVNYKDKKEQGARIKAHAPGALNVTGVVLAAGVLLGILSLGDFSKVGNTGGMIGAMAKPLVENTPAFIGSQLDIIMGVLGLPLGMIFGTDPYFYCLYPILAKVGINFDVSPKSLGLAMLIGKNLSLFVSPLVPATFMGLALTGVELKDHIKYSVPWLAVGTLVMVAGGVILGII